MQTETVQSSGSAQQIDVQKGAEVADVSVVVDGWAATVEAELLAV
jgi:hypothetical protein